MKILITLIVIQVCLAGCYSPAGLLKTPSVDTNAVMQAIRDKWNLSPNDQLDGIPIVTLTPLTMPPYLYLRPRSYVFKITAYSPYASYGPPSITASCVVGGSQVTIIEDEFDACTFLSPNTPVHNEETVLYIVKTFGVLCGYKLQIGMPIKGNWVYLEEPEVYRKLHSYVDKTFPLCHFPLDSEEFPLQDIGADPNQWALEITRTEGEWRAQCTYMSVDNVVFSRYEILVSKEGKISAKRLHELYTPFIYM